MIYLRQLNGTQFVINAELIEFVEAKPDTVISLTTGRTIMVKESVEDVVQAVIRYKQSVFSRWRESPEQES